MDRRLIRIARLLGAFIGTFAGVSAVQFMRLRRMEFLPMHPGFYVNHVVAPTGTRSDDRRLRLVVLGDSTTAGVGVGRAEDALPYRLAQHIADRERRPVHVVSYGWAGARVADLPSTQLPRALEPLREGETAPFLPGADIVAVVIGSNDATHHTKPGRYRAHLRRALETLRQSAPEARVVLAGIPAFRGALKAIEPLISLADLYARPLRRISRAEAARAGVAYADLARHVPPRIDRTTEFLSSDRFHPSAVGYAIWAEVIFEALVEGPAASLAPPPSAVPMEPAGA